MEPQNEDRMDENDIQSLREAKKWQDQGESIVTSLKDPLKFQPYLDSLTQSLAKRESVLGRYNYVTAQSYTAIGNVYTQMEEPRSVVMFRTCYRIHTFLYGRYNGQISGLFKDLLDKRGLTPRDIEAIREDILQSTKHEMEGDLLRRFGDKKAAVLEYQKAARVEEFAFGRDNPDLAYLWRKMACLASVNKGFLTTVDFDEADRMGSKWMRHSKDVVSPAVCASIRRGDRYCGSLLYTHAVGEYLKATTMEGMESRKSKASKKTDQSRRQTPRSPKKSKPSAGMSEELRMLLAGEIQAPPPTPEPSLAPSQDKRKIENKASGPHNQDADQHVEPKPYTVAAEASLLDTQATTKAGSETVPETSHGQESGPPHPPSPETDSEPSHTGRVDEMIQRLRQHEALGRGRGPDQLPASDASFVSALSEASKLAPEKPEAQKHLVVSTPKIRRKPRASHSEPSAVQAIKTTTHEPKKPKSESYLSKIASKTSKMARRQKPKSEPHIFVPQRSSRSVQIEDDKPKTFPYLLLGSPPATPFQLNDDAGTFLKVAVDAKSIASFNLMESPGKKPKSLGDSIADSVADSHFIPTSQHKPPIPVTGLETSNLAAMEINGLDRFFTDKNESLAAMTPCDQPSLTEQSVMTSDEDIRRRFLSETAQLAHTMQETEPSLVELVAHIQTMSSLLQRQTFRLQNKLRNQPKTSDKHMKHVKRPIPSGSKEIYQEVETLFKDCDETLDKAFSRLEGADDNHVLEDYRKTFTLEKAFLEEMRHKVSRILVNQSVLSITVGENEVEVEAKPSLSGLSQQSESSTAAVLNKAEDTNPSFRWQNESEATFQTQEENSMLSIVFEDTNSTPSERNKPLVDISDTNSSFRWQNESEATFQTQEGDMLSIVFEDQNSTPSDRNKPLVDISEK
jgi:hypothetical protein